MKKNILLSLGTIAATVAPIATVVACGSTDNQDGMKKFLETLTTSTLLETEFKDVQVGFNEAELDEDDKEIAEEFYEVVELNGDIASSLGIDADAIADGIAEVNSNLTLSSIMLMKESDSKTITYSIPEIEDFEVEFTDFAEIPATPDETIASLKSEIEDLDIATTLDEVAFKAATITDEAITGSSQEISALGITVPAVELGDATVKLSKVETEAKLVFEISLEGATDVTAEVVVDEFAISPDEKVAAVKAEIDAFDIATTLDEVAFKTATITNGAITGSSQEISALGITVPAFDIQGTTVTLSKSATSADLVFTITLTDATDSTSTVSVDEFAATPPANTDQADVDAIINEIDQISIPKSNKNDADLTASELTDHVWDGTELDFTTELGLILPAISNGINGTTITLNKTAGILTLEVTVTKGSATAGATSVTLVAADPVAPVGDPDQDRANAIATELNITVTSTLDAATINPIEFTAEAWDGTELDLTADLGITISTITEDMTDVTITRDKVVDELTITFAIDVNGKTSSATLTITPV